MVDSPDRHGDPADWLPRLEELAYDAGRPLAVVATVMSLPAGWTGPAAASATQPPTQAPTPTLPPATCEASTTPETEDAK